MMTTRESELKHVTATEGIAYNTLRQLIHWDSAMALGDAAIDAEHQQIIALAERACLLSRDHENTAELVKAFVEFGELLFRHFDHEEQQLSHTDADSLRQHKEQHMAMRSEYEFVRKRLEANGVGWAYEEQSLVVVNFMIGVTVGHVLETDARHVFDSK